MTVILNMKKPYDHSTSEDVRNLAEATFIAVEPFLQPIKKHEKLIWPHGPAVEIFLNVLLERYKVLNEFDPGKHILFIRRKKYGFSLLAIDNSLYY